MPVPTYVPITDAQLAPEKPFTSSLAKQFRDNMLSVIGGGLDAPTMGPGLLGIGGGRADGLLTDAWTPTLPGYYDFESDEPSILSTPRSAPWFTCLRLYGDLTLSSLITINNVPDDDKLLALMGLSRGNAGAMAVGTAGEGSGGGGHHGAGGDSEAGPPNLGGTARSLSGLNRWWLSRTLPCGGQGGTNYSGASLGGLGGGVAVLLVEGDIDATGGGISAPGEVGHSSSGAGGSSGGGAAGTIIVACTGTVIGGTWSAVGGAGGTRSPGDSGGGSGGAVIIAANAYGTVPTTNVAGGSGPGGATDGGAGIASLLTISAELLRGLFWR